MEPDERDDERDWGAAAEKIERFVQMVVQACAMRLSFALERGAAAEGFRLRVEFGGPDTELLVARNAEVLRAMESLASEVIGLAAEEHHLLSFDAEGYKARRVEQIRQAAETAMVSVRATGRPYSFPPMNSRERRMLHMELAGSELRTASSGDPSRRFVVVYPAESESGAGKNDRTERLKTIRSAFRPRG